MSLQFNILLTILTLISILNPTLESLVHDVNRIQATQTADEYFGSELTDDPDENYDYDITNETLNLHRIQLADRFGFGTAQDEPLSQELVEEFIRYANERQKQDPQIRISTSRPCPNPKFDENSGFAIGSLGQRKCPPGCFRSFDQKCYPSPTYMQEGCIKIICQPVAHSRSGSRKGTQFQRSRYLVMLIFISGSSCYF